MLKYITQNNFIYIFFLILPFILIHNFFDINYYYLNKDFPFFLNPYSANLFYWDIYSNSNEGNQIDIIYYFQDLLILIYSYTSLHPIIANVFNKLFLVIPMLANYIILTKIISSYNLKNKYIYIFFIISLPLFNNYQHFFNLGLMGLLLLIYSYSNNLFINNFNKFSINIILSTQLVLLYPRFIVPFIFVIFAYILKNKSYFFHKIKNIFLLLVIFFLLNIFSIFTFIDKFFFKNDSLYNPSIINIKNSNHYNFINFFDTFSFYYLDIISLIIFLVIITILLIRNFQNKKNLNLNIFFLIVVIAIKFLLFYYYKFYNNIIFINNPHIYFTITDICLLFILLNTELFKKKFIYIFFLSLFYISFTLSKINFSDQFHNIKPVYFSLHQQLKENDLYNKKIILISNNISRINSADDQLNIFNLSRTFTNSKIFTYNKSIFCDLSLISTSMIDKYEYIFLDTFDIDNTSFMNCYSDYLNLSHSFDNFYVYKINS